MKKLAFFVALFIGLNTSSVARRPEEEAQAVVQHDKLPARSSSYMSVFQLISQKIVFYFYAVTKEGAYHQIRWELISELVGKNQYKNRINKIVYQLEKRGKEEKTRFDVF